MLGVYKDKEKALKKALKQFLDEISTDMICESFIFDENDTICNLKSVINHQLEKFSYINFKQDVGYGHARLVLDYMEVE